ncbi:Multidrug resistance ABC transporter ATP-binding/permease protein BmrA [Rhodoplanes serenus]|uniref:Multidrug resistance ABC transporter ATP-binding/permease protein BmrA n=1 Tax=Rhodoplanes serenus TaxID=200615 RepID=A0A447D250_9BRAD|nr:ABC transporter transmembrane domain-containing protein [Rhodoplanes serenus]VCU11627.1 Multidrug resistance ABC transporter ATP-binding/permease protein BmrA [Rhodoplanes serenus]
MNLDSGGRGLGSTGPQSGEVTAGRRDIRPLLAVVPYVMRYKGRALAALIALVTASLATLVLPVAVRRMIDVGFTQDAAGLIHQYFTVLLIVAGVLAAASALRYYLVTTLGERIVSDLRTRVFEHLTALSAGFFDSAKSGELISRLSGDATQLKSAVGASVSITLRNLLLFLGSTLMMVVTSPRLSLFVLAAIPVIVLPLVAFGRIVRRRSREAQDTLAEASGYAAELIGAIRTLQAFTNEAMATHRFAAAVERAFAAAVASTKARAWLTGIAIFMVFASVVVILWVGAQDVADERMTAGRLSQFVIYAVFAAGALGELSQVWGEISQAAGAAERLNELLAIEPDIEVPASPVPLPAKPRGEVAFEAVRFHYPTRPEVAALDGVSFTARAGEKVAIVGPSGAGKSTLFHLMLRFYDPDSGAVRFDGVRLAEADPRAVRSRIALVPQDAAVFGASVAENIRFGRPDASDADVARAAELAAASEFIARLPQGMDTPVGERGVLLSGGERQRLAIARAILREAPLLLLDEATSSLDAENETLVKTALARLMQGRTTLVIAHRLATVLSCDRILVMDQGRIVEEGTHDSLVQQGGLYARLARLQFDTSPEPMPVV